MKVANAIATEGVPGASCKVGVHPGAGVLTMGPIKRYFVMLCPTTMDMTLGTLKGCKLMPGRTTGESDTPLDRLDDAMRFLDGVGIKLAPHNHRR